MSTVRMHEDELLFDEELVRRLLAAQFPQWARLPLARPPSVEHDWLPRLAPHLPVEISEPVANARYRLGQVLKEVTA